MLELLQATLLLTSDYSTWRYGITANYAALKQGQNKITAKISCAASPTNLTKFNSLNVTGIGIPNTINGQNGKNGANGISSGGNGASAVGGNGGNGGRGGNGGNGGRGGNGGNAFSGIG